MQQGVRRSFGENIKTRLIGDRQGPAASAQRDPSIETFPTAGMVVVPWSQPHDRLDACRLRAWVRDDFLFPSLRTVVHVSVGETLFLSDFLTKLNHQWAGGEREKGTSVVRSNCASKVEMRGGLTLDAVCDALDVDGTRTKSDTVEIGQSEVKVGRAL